MNKSKASGVSWVKPAEPSFLKKFKSNANYKEGPTVDTKVKPRPLTVWLGLASTSCMLTELDQCRLLILLYRAVSVLLTMLAS